VLGLRLSPIFPGLPSRFISTAQARQSFDCFAKLHFQTRRASEEITSGAKAGGWPTFKDNSQSSVQTVA